MTGLAPAPSARALLSAPRGVGGSGKDIIYSRAGDDTIHAADGEPDEVNCGDGADTVFFDQDLDKLGSKCDNLNPPPEP